MKSDFNRKLTSFQKRVYDAARQIPCGRVTTYKILAEYLNCGSCRAIGQALRHNPFAPKIPCHRVVTSDLTIGGFQGCRNGVPIKKKTRLLKKEGVEFKNGKIADQKTIYRYSKTTS